MVPRALLARVKRRRTMGVLDRQSIRDRAPNRRLGERALEERERLREGAAERRRPDRGRGARAARPRPSGRPLMAERLEALVRVAALIALAPLQLAILLLRPVELCRRLRAAPERVQARTRRLRMQSRDPETAAGRLRQTARVSVHFLREEVADMQDGFPRVRDVVSALLGGLERAATRLGLFVGLLDERGAPEERRERLFRACAVGLVAAAGLIGLYVSIYQAADVLKQNDRLTLRAVDISGLHRVREDDVLGHLDLPGGMNLLDLNLPELKERVEALPWVASAQVERDLRSQRLQVRVMERQPALILGSGGLRLVDEQGVVFKPLERGDPADLPLLSAKPSQVSVATAAALEVLTALRSGVAVRPEDASELRWSDDDGLTLVTRTGLPIRLGRQGFAARLSRLERAVASGGLPLDALKEVDAGLRDRLVAVPLSKAKAKKVVAARMTSQPVAAQSRALMLQLQRVARASEGKLLFGGGHE